MSIGALSANPAVYQVPVTAQAKADDERTESTSTRVREADSGKEAAAAPISSGKVDLKV